MKKNKIKPIFNKGIIKNNTKSWIYPAPLFLIPKKSGAGFTLLEIIVSVTLFVFVILLSGSLFSFSQEAYTKGSERGELTQNVRVALDRITRELRQAVNIITTWRTVDDNQLDPPDE